MDDAAHGENFSSPSDNRTITAIKRRAVGLFDRIELSDGSCFLIHPQFSPPFDYTIGSGLTAEKVDVLASLAESGRAWEKALALISRRSHSRQELKLKLIKRNFIASAVEAVLDRLVEKNLVNDHVFAEQWVLSRLSKHPEGYYAILAGLRRKGIRNRQAEEVLQKVYTEEAALDAAQRLWEKGLRKGKSTDELETLIRKKGFRPAIVSRFFSGESDV